MANSVELTNGGKTTVHELLEWSTREALKTQRDDGSFPPAERGFYNDPKTPVRTTSYWLLALLKVHEITNEDTFLRAANDAISYLTSDAVRPNGESFYCRKSSEKDRCNGLYGQAQPLWALSTAADYLNRNELYSTAEDVVLRHPFDEVLTLWNRKEVDGRVLSFDRTLNHQLAFAASVSMIDRESCRNLSTTFLNGLTNRMAVRDDGVIRHLVKTPIARVGRLSTKNKLVSIRNRLLFDAYAYSSAVRHKEIGYQAVNLFWLSHLRNQHPDHEIWQTSLIDDALSVIRNDRFRSDLSKNEMAFTNHPTGFALAFAAETFRGATAEARFWAEEQIERSFDFSTGLLGKGSTDSTLMASTICYAAPLPNLTLEVN